MKVIRKARLAVAALAVLPLLALSACSGANASSSSSSTSGTSGSSLSDGLTSRAKNRTVYFLTYYNPASDVFWNQILTGAQDAAKLANLKLVHETTDGTDASKMVDLINTATATKPAAIVVSFNDPAWEQATCDAASRGISVFAYNVPPSGVAKNCVKSFVGQDFYAVGQIVATQLLKDVSLKAGDKVLCPAEEPTQQYAIQRGGGVNAVLKTVGVQCTYLRTGGDDAGALDKMTAWLTANKDAKAIVPLGGTPHRNAVAAENAAGATAPILGFDTSPQVVAGIESGRILGTADQQGYVQGFDSVMQAALYLNFGISPANINSGGNGLIDKSNVGNLSSKDLEGVRW